MRPGTGRSSHTSNQPATRPGASCTKVAHAQKRCVGTSPCTHSDWSRINWPWKCEALHANFKAGVRTFTEDLTELQVCNYMSEREFSGQWQQLAHEASASCAQSSDQRWSATGQKSRGCLCPHRCWPHWGSWQQGHPSRSWPIGEECASQPWAEECQLCGTESSKCHPGRSNAHTTLLSRSQLKGNLQQELVSVNVQYCMWRANAVNQHHGWLGWLGWLDWLDWFNARFTYSDYQHGCNQARGCRGAPRMVSRCFWLLIPVDRVLN